MAKDFLPRTNPELLAWSAAFLAYIQANAANVGLVAAQATQYQTYHNDFATKLAVSSAPLTRTRGNVEATNASRLTLKAYARELARVANAFPGTTNQERIDMGVNPRDTEPSPINPPTESPVLSIVSANGRILKLKLQAIDSDRRGKPEGVHGADVYSFVGANPPADVGEWKYEGGTTRTTFDVEFPPTVAGGSQVWFTAQWKNPRDMTGPACQPITGYVAGGVISEAA